MRPILSQLPLDLGDGLRLRLANASDSDALGDFNRRLFDDGRDDGSVSRFVHHATSGGHPTHGAEDYTIVEKEDTGEIVSSCCLISQTWSYSGAPFKVGQPEFVATAEPYRRRGLVRKQFDLLHEMSAERGELMQVITGIPWYYSLFGYEMALNLNGGWVVAAADIPKQPESPTCRVRPMVREDEPYVRKLHEAARVRQPVAVERTDEQWEYAFRSGLERGLGAKEWVIIERPSGERIGYVAYDGSHEDDGFSVRQLELEAGLDYTGLMPALLSALWECGAERLATGIHPTKVFKVLRLICGTEHPSYAALQTVKTNFESQYAFFVRIADLIAYLNAVRTGLERNLVGSVAEGFSGELTISFYRSGVRLAFDEGRITEIEPHEGDAQASFPYELFLHLLCGRRRTSELTEFFAECSASDEAAALLDALFPPFTGVLLTLM